MSLVFEVPQTAFQSAAEVPRSNSKCRAPKTPRHFEVPRYCEVPRKCRALTACSDSVSGRQRHYGTSISYFYQKREKRMKQERKTHVYRGEFMAALQSAVVVSGGAR